MVTAAAVLWGTLGPTFKGLEAVGAGPVQIAFWRTLIAGTVLLAWLAVRRPSLLRIAPRDLPFFVAYGLVSVAIYFVLYPTAVQLAGVAIAAVLLYTAPAWVALMAALFFRERVSGRKLLAISLTFAGSALVVGIFGGGGMNVTLWGLLAGLASGFTYATLGIFGKGALRRYSPPTAMLYALGIGSLFLALPVLREPTSLLAPLQSATGILLLLYVSLVPTAGSFLLYTTGLQRLNDAGRASVIATIEPLVAVLLGYLLLGEALARWQWLGGTLILLGVLILRRE